MDTDYPKCATHTNEYCRQSRCDERRICARIEKDNALRPAYIASVEAEIARLNYRCAVCGSSDPDHYVRCQHPGCLDGRDRPNWRRHLDPPMIDFHVRYRLPVDRSGITRRALFVLALMTCFVAGMYLAKLGG